eukprot:gene16325-19419_t
MKQANADEISAKSPDDFKNMPCQCLGSFFILPFDSLLDLFENKTRERPPVFPQITTSQQFS